MFVVDYQRDIIVYAIYVSENSKEEKYKDMFNIRIKKKDPLTGEFEDTSYKGKIRFANSYYNDTEGHLILQLEKKIIFLALSANFEKFENFQEINLEEYEFTNMVTGYDQVLNGFIMSLKDDSSNIFTFTKNKKYELLQNLIPKKKMGRNQRYYLDPTSKNIVIINIKQELEVWEYNLDSQKYDFSWNFSFASESYDISPYSCVFDKNGYLFTRSEPK